MRRERRSSSTTRCCVTLSRRGHTASLARNRPSAKNAASTKGCPQRQPRGYAVERAAQSLEMGHVGTLALIRPVIHLDRHIPAQRSPREILIYGAHDAHHRLDPIAALGATAALTTSRLRR